MLGRAGQHLMNNSRPQSPRLSVSDSHGNDLTEGMIKPTFHSTDIFGCQHYKTGCAVRAECCASWFTCRLCHDDALQGDHVMDRHKTKIVMCFQCSLIQDASQSCIRCKKVFARYYCDKCKLWDDEASRAIYHCEGCGICRRGTRNEFVHCERCVGCIAVDYFKSHKCLDRSMRSNCPICGEDLFSTTAPVIFMPCGHPIHYLCHQEHSRSSYQCPICLKSISDMSHLFARIDELMATQVMPEEYSHVKSQVLCNDCEQKSLVPFHFVYHRCTLCSSYNTKLLRTFNDPAVDANDALETSSISSTYGSNYANSSQEDCSTEALSVSTKP